MTYFEQTQTHQGIIDHIRNMVAGRKIPSPFGLTAPVNFTSEQRAIQLDKVAKLDVGVSREYQDYSTTATCSRSSNRRLHSIAEMSKWNL